MEKILCNIMIYDVWITSCFLIYIYILLNWKKKVRAKNVSKNIHKKELLEKINIYRNKIKILKNEYNLLCNNKIEKLLLHKFPNAFGYIKCRNYMPICYIVIPWIVICISFIRGFAVPLSKNKMKIFIIILLSLIILTLIFMKFFSCMSKINNFFDTKVQANLINMDDIFVSYCVISYYIFLLIFMNDNSLKKIIPYHQFTKIILIINLIIIYKLVFKILIRLISARYNILKRTNEDSLTRFKNMLRIVISVIIIFVCIFCLLNSLLYKCSKHSFICNITNYNISSWDIIYYSISIFLTFCAENIIANNMLSQLVCLLSRITTIFIITILLSVIISLLPNNDMKNM